MDESTAEAPRSGLLLSVVGVGLAALATIALVAAMSGLRAEAAPEPGGSDVALFDGDRGLWHLRYEDGTVESFYFGDPGDLPLLGDWDCDGIDTVALFRPGNGYVYLRNSNTFGFADQFFFYGVGGDVPVAGDWDGDGCDSLGVQRNGEFFLADALGTVPANTQFFYGLPDDVPFAGDFDGDGRDTIGLHRAGRVFISNANLDGQIPDSAQKFDFGLVTDFIVAGDWDADGDDSAGLYRHSDHRFLLAFENGQSFSDRHIDFGTGDWQPVVGSFGESPPSLAATLVGAR